MKTLFLIFLLPMQVLAQDLTGIWTGIIETTGTKLSYELVISENKNKLSGYSMTVFLFEGVENIGVKSMKFKRRGNELSIEDGELIYNNYSSPPKRVKLFGTLFLSGRDSLMRLNGEFKTKSFDLRDQSYFVGTIELKKQNDISSTKLVSKLDEMNLLPPLTISQPKIKGKEKTTTVVVEMPEPNATKDKEPETVVVIDKPRQVPTIKKENETTVVVEKPKPIVTKDKGPETNIVAEKPKQVTTKENEKETTVAVEKPKPVVKEEYEYEYEDIIIKKPKSAVPKDKEKETAVVEKPKPVEPKDKEKVATVEVEKPKPNEKRESEQPVTVDIKKQTVRNEQIDQPVQQRKQNDDVAILSPVIKKAEPKIVIPAAAALTQRKTEIIRSVFFKSDSVVLSLYDNGTIDGDTVSVVLNGRVIIARKGLTTIPLRMTIQMTPDLGDSLQLVMYAENLGSIPPNTGMLIIQDGDERNEISFAGDMQKSSAVILRRKR